MTEITNVLIKDSKSSTYLPISRLMLKSLIPYRDTFLINYPKLVITKGYLPPVVVTSVGIAEKKLRITWFPNQEINLAENKDKAIVVMYCISQGLFFIPNTTTNRESGEYTTPIPENWSSGDVLVWLFFENELETECSTCAFLGEF